jgi:hypothetical protein
VADLQEANTNDIAIEDDIELASAVDEIEISDADSAEIDAIGEVIGGIGGGGLEIASPTAWSEAVNGGIEQWFSMFDRQRQASRSPCYALSLLMEYRDKFQRPAQTYRLAEDLAQAEVDYANQLWQAEIGQAALAEAVFAVVDLRAFVTITDWVVAGQEQRIRRIRGFLPARRSDVINQEPNNYRTVTDPGVQPPGCDDWAKRGCWISLWARGCSSSTTRSRPTRRPTWCSPRKRAAASLRCRPGGRCSKRSKPSTTTSSHG